MYVRLNPINIYLGLFLNKYEVDELNEVSSLDKSLLLFNIVNRCLTLSVSHFAVLLIGLIIVNSII